VIQKLNHFPTKNDDMIAGAPVNHKNTDRNAIVATWCKCGEARVRTLE